MVISAVDPADQPKEIAGVQCVVFGIATVAVSMLINAWKQNASGSKLSSGWRRNIGRVGSTSDHEKAA